MDTDKVELPESQAGNGQVSGAEKKNRNFDLNFQKPATVKISDNKERLTSTESRSWDFLS